MTQNEILMPFSSHTKAGRDELWAQLLALAEPQTQDIDE